MTRPANIPELKDRIRTEIADITVEMRKKAAHGRKMTFAVDAPLNPNKQTNKKAALAYRERLGTVIENDVVTSRCTTELKVNGFVPNLVEYNPKLVNLHLQ